MGPAHIEAWAAFQPGDRLPFSALLRRRQRSAWWLLPVAVALLLWVLP